MAVSYMDFTSPNTQYFFDINNSRFFTKNQGNYINALGVDQLNTLGNVSLLDIYLTSSNVVEPHTHQNATELVYCVAGSAIVSILNPFTKVVLEYVISPSQVANVPQGWVHWIIATVDHTHLIAIFDAPVPEFIPVSDFLRLAPRDLLAHTYCLNEEDLTQVLAPIKSTVVIGPPADCEQQGHTRQQNNAHIHANLSPPLQRQRNLPPNRNQNRFIIGNGRKHE
ncbi:cupin domain-containing protein [Paenibacillus endoradicis]|uniref:cupin domain-containing protein n=1 Tax=Paenibacillus endoradicis TaxID=2972487 RepID=UPI002158DB35|nr:cupin domain-containing protein [Paenibacillus endoradicis]MCR8657357.1 cupin domain-containing protein [Paenibacillus endoradicis]